MSKTIQSYVLGVQLAVDGAQGLSTLKTVDKQTTKNASSFTQLGKEVKKAVSESDNSLEKLHQQIEKTSAGFKKLGLEWKAMKLGDKSDARKFGRDFADNAAASIKDYFSNLGPTIGASLGTAIAPGIGSAIGGTLGTAIQAGLEKAAGPILSHITRGLELNDQLELAQTHFTAFIGDEKEAAKYLEYLSKLSIDTGLALPDLISGSQRLEEFNDDLGLTKLELRAAADQAARFGSGVEGFHALADILGLIAEKGELSSKSLNKLYKLGINAPKLLSEATGKSEKEIKRLLAAGRIDGTAAARLISEGIERQSGGYAKYVSENTSYGMERKASVLQDQIDIKGTRNVQRLLDDLTAAKIAVLESDKAQKAVEFIDQAAGQFVDVIEKAVRDGVSIVQSVSDGQMTIKSLMPGGGLLKDLTGKFPSINSGHFSSGLQFLKSQGHSDKTPEETKRELEQLLGDPRLQGFLAAIRNAEHPATMSEADKYRELFGGKLWDLSKGSPFGKFKGANYKGKPTHAALGYQFEPGTWKDATRALGIDPNQVDPHTQDLVAAYLLKRIGALDAVLQDEIEKAIQKSIGTWPSLPGGSQQTRTMGQFTAAMRGGQVPAQSDKDIPIAAYETDYFPSGIWGVGKPKMRQIMGGAFPVPHLPTGVTPVYVVNNASRAPEMGDAKLEPKLPLPLPAALKTEDVARQLGNLDWPQIQAGLQQSLVLVEDSVTGLPVLMKKSFEDYNRDIRAQYTYTTEQMKENAERAILSIRTQFEGAMQSAFSFLPQGGAPKGKRGFFSKLLGVAAPFLQFIPGVGPIASQLASIGSQALAGNWQGAASGAMGLSFVQSFLNPTKSATSGGVRNFSPSHEIGHSVGAASTLNIPKFASGGRYHKGRSVIVGDGGREEVFEADYDGWIHPSINSFAQSRASRRPNVSPEIFLNRANEENGYGSRHGGGSINARLIELLERSHQLHAEHRDVLHRHTAALERFESMPAHEVVRTGLPRAMSQDAGLIDQMGRRLRLA